MSDADKIREYAYENFVKPAREQNKLSFTIAASDIHIGLNFKKPNFPNICQALSGKSFWELYGLNEPERTGPKESNTTTFKYTFDTHNSNYIADLNSNIGISQDTTRRKKTI